MEISAQVSPTNTQDSFKSKVGRFLDQRLKIGRLLDIVWEIFRSKYVRSLGQSLRKSKTKVWEIFRPKFRRFLDKVWEIFRLMFWRCLDKSLWVFRCTKAFLLFLQQERSHARWSLHMGLLFGIYSASVMKRKCNL